MKNILLISLVLLCCFPIRSSAQNVKLDKYSSYVVKIISTGLWTLAESEEKQKTSIGELPLCYPDIGHGSGLLISPDGLIMTNRHVVEESNGLAVKIPGMTRSFAAKIVYIDQNYDIAFIQINANAKILSYYNFTKKSLSNPGMGATVNVLGYPVDINQADPAYTSGVVSRWTDEDGQRLIQISAPVSPGNSGGPVFDDSGKLVGLVVSKKNEGENYNLVIPSKELEKSMNDMAVGDDIRIARQEMSGEKWNNYEKFSSIGVNIAEEKILNVYESLYQLIAEQYPEANIFNGGIYYLEALKEFENNNNDSAIIRIIEAKDFVKTGVRLKASLSNNDFVQFLLSVRIEPPETNNYQPDDKLTQKKPVTADTILRIHGSNTIGSNLVPAFAESYLRSLNATDITIEPDLEAIEKVIKGKVNNKLLVIEVKAHGSGTAFKDLGNHACDIGMSSRPINEKESLDLRSLGNLTSYSCENIIGLDGIAIIVNRRNSLNEMNLSDIAKIFSGEITNWAQVSSTMNGPINTYSRDDKSGTYDSFKHMVLERDSKAKKNITPSAKRFESNDEITESVSRDYYGIGFVGLPYIKNSKSVGIYEPGSSTFYPNVFTVRTEDYPLSRRLFFYVPEYSNNNYVNEFINFAKSEEGQKIVEEIGFVSMEIESKSLEEGDIAINPDKRYLETTSFAERLSFNFRFRFGSSELDNKAMDDIDRLTSFLSKPERRYSRVFLLGFADGIGSDEACYNVALNRATSISDQLMKRGIKPFSITSFGKTNPVADNNTETGREKNRRVEVWIRK